MARKIIITGTTCTGKTTLGRKIANEFSILQVDLDDLHFLPNWIEKDKNIFIEDVNNKTKGLENWIVTGSYQTILKDTVWQDASTIIWLDYSLNLIIRRFLIRTYKRVFLKEKCCGENYESLGSVFSKDSLFFWIFKSYWSRKERMNNWRNGIFSHKKWIVLRNPKDEKKLIHLL